MRSTGSVAYTPLSQSSSGGRPRDGAGSWIKVFSVRCLAFISVAIIAIGMMEAFFITYKLYPEIGMMVHSQCSSPLYGWRGRIWGYQVMKTPDYMLNESFHSYSYESFDRRLGEEDGIEEDGRYLVGSGSAAATSGSSTSTAMTSTAVSATGATAGSLSTANHHSALAKYDNKDVIVVASHHKTGTFLMQKIFARICAMMNWCCIFHVTKDSLAAVKNSLSAENVHLISHTQWAWSPEDLGIPYRFIHLYRHPYAKITSGYRYHMDGVEGWSTVPQHYDHACNPPKPTTGHNSHTGSHDKSAAAASSAVATSGVHRSLSKEDKKKEKKQKKEKKSKGSSPTSVAETETGPLQHTSKRQIFEFCQSVHLCETCCRVEHESTFGSHKYNPSRRSSNNGHASDAAKAYVVRPHKEYDFLCQHLRKVNTSLMDALKDLPMEEGVRVEAAVDFYEGLRMARIINDTWADPRSLNIDLDYFMGNYETAVRIILAHINVDLTKREMDEIVEELNFYDINASPIYRLSMSNPLVNHINQESEDEKKKLKALVKADDEIKEFYRPILSLMDTVLQKTSQSAGMNAAFDRLVEWELKSNARDKGLGGKARSLFARLLRGFDAN